MADVQTVTVHMGPNGRVRLEWDPGVDCFDDNTTIRAAKLLLASTGREWHIEPVGPEPPWAKQAAEAENGKQTP